MISRLAGPLTLVLGLLGQGSPPGPVKAPEVAARLDLMKKAVDFYQVHATDSATAYPLQAEPVLRFTNPISGVPDGAVFFWTSTTGRPEATVQVYQGRSGTWVHEFTSLSLSPLVAEKGSSRIWSPDRGGVALRTFPDAPRPAETPAQRLRQMRGLAEGFTISDRFRGENWHSLRLMARPLARYGRSGSDPDDGALFAFALGTNPEAFLLIESRSAAGGRQWQYALAPMSGYPLKASYRDQEIWTLPLRSGVETVPTDPFFVTRPEPKP